MQPYPNSVTCDPGLEDQNTAGSYSGHGLETGGIPPKGKASSEPCQLCAPLRKVYAQKVETTIRHLRDAGNVGCILCSAINDLLTTVTSGAIAERLLIEIKFKPNYPLRVSYREGNDWASSKRFEVSPAFAENIFPEPLNSMEPFPDITADFNGSGYIDRIKEWLDLCEKLHPYCFDNPMTTLPKRVLDLDGIAGFRTLKLIEGNGVSSRYIALSHCWGKTQNCKTEFSTIAHRLCKIDFDELPKTFQQAVSLTQALGIRYLWIDSLCIIQDDRIDWEIESAKMAQIYKDAWLTIAASLSPGDDHGFLEPRDRYLTSQLKVHLKEPVAGKETESFKVREMPPKHYRRDVGSRNRNWRDNMTVPAGEPEPLESRAWTFQERLVSTRLVSFCKNELDWDCATLSTCECESKYLIHVEHLSTVLQGSELIPGYSSIRSLYQTILILVHELQKPDMAPELLERLTEITRKHWRDLIVPSYSLLNLTKTEDRLPALSAIASVVKDIIKDEYLAGLWKEDLNMGLCWIARSFGLAGPQPGWRLENWNAPSWSWASTEGPVDCLLAPSQDVEYIAHVISASCKVSALNPFGTVGGGTITLSARAVVAWLRVSEAKLGEAEESVSYEICTKSGRNIASSVFPDTPLVELVFDSDDTGRVKTAARSFLPLRSGRAAFYAPVTLLPMAQLRKITNRFRGSRNLQGAKQMESNIKSDNTSPSSYLALILGRSVVVKDAYERIGIVDQMTWEALEELGYANAPMTTINLV